MSNYTEAQLRQMDDKELMRIYYSSTGEIERSPLLDTLFQRLEEWAKEVAYLEREIDGLLDQASWYRAEIEELKEEIDELKEKLEPPHETRPQRDRSLARNGPRPAAHARRKARIRARPRMGGPADCHRPVYWPCAADELCGVRTP